MSILVQPNIQTEYKLIKPALNDLNVTSPIKCPV